MSSQRAAPFSEAIALGKATSWAQQLGSEFRHVVLFAIDGTVAQPLIAFGLTPRELPTVSLVEQTPLRWTLEAASPLIGAGRAPGGDAVARALGLPVPRSYAVLPYMHGTHLLALAYVDNGGEPLPLHVVGQEISDFAEPNAPKGRLSAAKQPPPITSIPNLPPAPSAAPGSTIPPLTVLPEPAAPPPHAAPVAKAPAQPKAPVGKAPTPAPVQHATPHAVPPIKAVPVTPATPLTALGRAPHLRMVSVDDRELGMPAAPAAPLLPSLASAHQPSTNPPPPAPPTAAHRRLAAVPGTLLRVLAAVPRALAAVARRLHLGRAFAAAFGLMAATGATFLHLSAPTDRRDPAEIEVLDADNAVTIGRALVDANVIRSPALLNLMARFTGLDRALRAGTYEIRPSVWLWEVLDTLHRGQVQTVRVTLPEGLTLAETAGVWERQGLCKRDAFLAAAADPTLLAKYKIDAKDAEGFLYPETYTVARGVPAKVLVEMQLKAFFAHTRNLEETHHLSAAELYDRVIVASLVEREARDPTERARIAGVFYNRLDQDMRLESCATVQYLLDKPKERLTLDDVRIPSPYNTYLHPGLPPGPIANPGSAAFAAALTPENNDYLFFFALDDGSHHHHFSRTYAEHARAHRTLKTKLAESR